MKNLLLDIQTGADIGFSALMIVALIVFAAFCVVSVVAAVWKWVIIFRYSKLNKMQVSNGLTGAQTAQKLLEGLGITDVEVVKCNFFSAIFLGNSYSPLKKIIRLRKNIYNSTTLTAVALATQKVALAKRDHDGDKKLKARSILMGFGYFAPFAVVPLVLMGFLIDFFVLNNLGVFTIVFTCIAAAWYLSSFVVLILNIPIERQACKQALEFIKTANLLTEEEMHQAEKLYKTYITSYVLDFVTELLYIVWRILMLILRLAASSRD